MNLLKHLLFPLWDLIYNDILSLSVDRILVHCKIRHHTEELSAVACSLNTLSELLSYIKTIPHIDRAGPIAYI